eukprot:4336113-Amphidinium_carterae.1
MNRSILDEMLPHVHALKDHPHVIGGDWNIEPHEFPIPLAHGDTVVRPPSDNLPTSPFLGRKLDWFLISPHMRDSAGAEFRMTHQPNHFAVRIQLTASWVPQTFYGKLGATDLLQEVAGEWANRGILKSDGAARRPDNPAGGVQGGDQDPNTLTFSSQFQTAKKQCQVTHSVHSCHTWLKCPSQVSVVNNQLVSTDSDYSQNQWISQYSQYSQCSQCYSSH